MTFSNELTPFAHLNTRHRCRICRVVLVFLAGTAILVAALPGTSSAQLTNLVNNPSAEIDSNGNGVPDDFVAAGSGDNAFRYRRITDAYVGRFAAELTISDWTDGDRRLLATIDGSAVVPGHRYSLSMAYRSTVVANRTAYTRSGDGDWTHWFSGPVAPPTTTWLGAPFTTPPVPDGVTEIGFGLALTSVGTVITDAYSGFDLDGTTTPTMTTTTATTTPTTEGTTTTTEATTTTTMAVPGPSPIEPPWATEGETDLYVSPNGSDDNDGSRDRPFRQVQKAADVAGPGTVVHVATGEYGMVIAEQSGASGRPITFLSDEKWGARINQTGTDPAWINFSDYVDVVGFDMSAPRAHQGFNNRGNYVRVFDTHMHNVFTEGECTGGAGINHELYPGTGNAAIGNWIHEIGPVGCSLVHGVYVSNAGSFVQNNLVYDVSGWLLHFYHAADSATVTNNTVFPGDTSRGEGTEGGVTLCADEGNTEPADDFSVSNNIIRDVQYGITECGQMGENLGPNNVYQNNLFYNVELTTSLQNPDSGSVTADPKFVDWRPDGSGDYRLSSSSPGVDTGVSERAPTFDKDLIGRPVPAVNDRGAYEGGW
jgi:pectate disaccharide-lyase